MSEPEDSIRPDDLDRLLQTWAAGRDASAEQLMALQRRIVLQLTAESETRVTPAPQAPGVRFWPRGGSLSFQGGPAWFLAGAASVLFLLASFAWLSSGRTKGVPVVGPVPPQANASLPREQLLAKARLFAEMQAVFGGQLDWIAETTDHVELGLAKRATASDDARLLIIRIVVERRAKGDVDWKPIWATDVVALNEETVSLRPTQDAVPAALSLWAYRLPDGTVFVESDLTLGDSQPAIRAASVNVLENNRATQVTAGNADGAEYRVFQTAATLQDDVG